MAASELKIDPHEFDGSRVLVTGGTKGIGQAVASRLRDGGARVLITARERPGDLAEMDLFVAADITTAEGCAAIADVVLKRLGGMTSLSMSLAAPQRPLAALRCSMITNGNAHSP